MAAAQLSRLHLFGFICLSLCFPSSAQETRKDPSLGTLEGRVDGPRGAGLPGVTVRVDGQAPVSTNPLGEYLVVGIPAGEHTVSFSLAEHAASETVRIEGQETTRLRIQVDWPLAFAETLTVRAASRQEELLIEAPAATASLGASEIARRSAHGQLPLLLTSLPGAQLTQSGIYDFNLNARGFNTYVNRRILTLIDGRDPSIPTQAGGQEWAALSFPLDDLASVELVRGPGAALYGAGAFNGVLDLRTKSPAAYPGGRVRITGGEPESLRLDLIHAGSWSSDWHFKVIGGYSENEDPTLPRTESVEYEGLPLELIEPPEDRFDNAFGSLRLDRISSKHSFVLEAGTAEFGGTTFVSDLGRLQSTEAERPWARFRWQGPSLQFSGFYTAQDIRHAALAAGSFLYLDASHTGLEVQTNLDLADGRARLVAGASYGEKSSDSADPAGQQTVLNRPQDIDRQAVFGQLSYELSDSVKAVASLRWDDSTLHDSQFSPRLALVYAPHPRHTLRATYSEAFQSPTVAEFFLQAPVGAPLDLSPLEDALAPLLGGISLGFSDIPILAVGNESLAIEEITSYEVGYNGILGDDLFVTASYYESELSNFTTNLLFQVGTSLGRLNPDFGPYTPPPGLSPEASAAVLGALEAALPPSFLASLSNDAEGRPLFALLSRTNFGRAETRGLETSLTWAPSLRWTADVSYTYFDVEIAEQAAESPILPNTSEHQITAGVTYTGDRLEGSVRWRFVEGFEWSSGVFVGRVPDYHLIDVSAGYELSNGWRLGLQVTNLFDEEHIEQFGGDLLSRRALASLSYGW